MENQSKRPPRSQAEWVTFSIASLILGAIASLVLYSWATEQRRPPTLDIQTSQDIRESNGQFYVPFRLTNVGGETAESVQIVAELRVKGRVTASGDQQIDFLSQGEQQEGAFVFQQDPRQGEVVIRVASYQLP
jgi:uncharacterized protein (TIGR02588 family)